VVGRRLLVCLVAKSTIARVPDGEVARVPRPLITSLYADATATNGRGERACKKTAATPATPQRFSRHRGVCGACGGIHPGPVRCPRGHRTPEVSDFEHVRADADSLCELCAFRRMPLTHPAKGRPRGKPSVNGSQDARRLGVLEDIGT
jgi:hypothetical protein